MSTKRKVNVEGSSSSQASTPSKRFRKSQQIEREVEQQPEEEEDEPITSSQFQNQFISTLKEAGVRFTKPILTVSDSMAVRKELSKKLLKDSQALHEFVQAFRAIIDDESELKRFLLPFKKYDNFYADNVIFFLDMQEHMKRYHIIHISATVWSN